MLLRKAERTVNFFVGHQVIYFLVWKMKKKTCYVTFRKRQDKVGRTEVLMMVKRNVYGTL